MKFSFYLSLAFVLLTCNSIAQVYSDVDHKYGLDPTLYNGKVYRYYVRGKSIGTQFLHSPTFVKGSVTIKDMNYSNLFLNYDIYNQQLVFEYTGATSGLNRIIISNAWLQSFTLGDSYFELINLGNESRIYRVIGDEPYRVLYHYAKDLQVDGQVNSRSWRFSSPIRSSYLSIDQKIYRYVNNGSFIRHFSKEKHTLIRKFMREHRINMKKSNDDKILQLLSFIKSTS